MNVNFVLSILKIHNNEKLRAIAASKLDVVGSNMERDEIIRDLIPLVKKLSSDT